MKINTKKKTYEQVMALPRPPHKHPMKPSVFLNRLIKLITIPDMLINRFTCNKIGMERLKDDEPCLILMNHSCFYDLKLVYHIFGKRTFNIVTTNDGMVGIFGPIMRWLGCIPTNKFVSDLVLIRDIKYTIEKNKSSVLMFPEASYSFDGTATPLPDSLGRLVKMLKVPVISVTTSGAFARDPLYNGLQLRKVKVSAEAKYLLSPEDIATMSADAINEIIRKEYAFDQFRWQQENNVIIDEPFRADGLHRVLYKCAHCGKEDGMMGKGTDITCKHCGKVYTLTEAGFLSAKEGDTRFDHIPDWYKWERDEARKELENDTYNLDIDVEIGMLVDFKAIYMIGDGHLTHNQSGFRLTSNDGQLDYTQVPQASYSLYADYFWYEIGDVICIGNRDILYYCFPKDKTIPVAKARLATEELYKLKSTRRRR
ncbi:MAG: 1-acyl-sn-glycerol-3-phosphate acyltransferase [Oscillospiraceae bacterium]|nr:1-acyl-sn-glycerol-3-phosphate acyltransferase [Oscillospiraceae bacterium]